MRVSLAKRFARIGKLFPIPSPHEVDRELIGSGVTPESKNAPAAWLRAHVIRLREV